MRVIQERGLKRLLKSPNQSNTIHVQKRMNVLGG